MANHLMAIFLEHLPVLPVQLHISRGYGKRSISPAKAPIAALHRMRMLFSFSQSTYSDIVNSKPIDDVVIDVSRAAQIRDIEASFPPSNEPFDLSSLKHPNKPNVVAVESYEILPDSEVWANAYDLFKFSERPGERPADVRVEFPFFLMMIYCQILRFRLKIRDWIVPFCVQWNLMGTISLLIISQKKMRQQNC